MAEGYTKERFDREAKMLLEEIKDLKAQRKKLKGEEEYKLESYKLLMFEPKVYFEKIDSE